MARPTPIADNLAELMARHGFARVPGAEAREEAWKKAVGSLAAGDVIAEHTQIGKLSRGRLDVIVGHSTLVQELEFQKAILLKHLTEYLPDENIKDLRFRLGTIQ